MARGRKSRVSGRWLTTAIGSSRAPPRVPHLVRRFAQVLPRTVRDAPPRPHFPQPALADFCRRHGVKRLSLFGSILTDDFTPDSDVDMLVEFEPGRTSANSPP